MAAKPVPLPAQAMPARPGIKHGAAPEHRFGAPAVGKQAGEGLGGISEILQGDGERKHPAPPLVVGGHRRQEEAEGMADAHRHADDTGGKQQGGARNGFFWAVGHGVRRRQRGIRPQVPAKVPGWKLGKTASGTNPRASDCMLEQNRSDSAIANLKPRTAGQVREAQADPLVCRPV